MTGQLAAFSGFDANNFETEIVPSVNKYFFIKRLHTMPFGRILYNSTSMIKQSIIFKHSYSTSKTLFLIVP